MTKRKFIDIVREFDNNDMFVSETSSTSYELTPDIGKAFKNIITGEVIVKESDNTGAIILIPDTEFYKYEEIIL